MWGGLTRWNLTDFRRRLRLSLLWPWHLTFDPKANQYIYEHKYICDQNWVKDPSLAFQIWCSQRFAVIACCDLELLTHALTHWRQSKFSNLILDYEHWAQSWSWFLGSQPTGDISHKPGGRLQLLSTRPAVTFSAKEKGWYQIIQSKRSITNG